MNLDICDWLRDFLKGGPKEVSRIRRAAKEAGYSRFQLREARRICCIQTTNNWSEDHPATDRWYWSLPEDES